MIIYRCHLEMGFCYHILVTVYSGNGQGLLNMLPEAEAVITAPALLHWIHSPNKYPPRGQARNGAKDKRSIIEREGLQPYYMLLQMFELVLHTRSGPQEVVIMESSLRLYRFIPCIIMTHREVWNGKCTNVA